MILYRSRQACGDPRKAKNNPILNPGFHLYGGLYFSGSKTQRRKVKGATPVFRTLPELGGFRLIEPPGNMYTPVRQLGLAGRPGVPPSKGYIWQA